MINLLRHIPTGADVQFDKPPTRGNDTSSALRQSSARDSDGVFYSYGSTSSKLKTFPLIYDGVPLATLNNLLTFVQSRNGDKGLFLWYDHESAEHSVRFDSGRVDYRETSPGKYRVAFQIIKEA